MNIGFVVTDSVILDQHVGFWIPNASPCNWHVSIGFRFLGCTIRKIFGSQWYHGQVGTSVAEKPINPKRWCSRRWTKKMSNWKWNNEWTTIMFCLLPNSFQTCVLLTSLGDMIQVIYITLIYISIYISQGLWNHQPDCAPGNCDWCGCASLSWNWTNH